MTHILIIWTIVAATGSQYRNDQVTFSGWRPMGEFSSEARCEAAAKRMNLKPGYYVCTQK